MKTERHGQIVLHDLEPTQAEFKRDLLEGLLSTPKRLDCKYLYDAEGARLFDRICGLEEYYPTRTEIGILEEALGEIVEAIGADAVLVELGSGSGRKTRLLLDSLRRPVAYIPVDIAKSQLIEVAQVLGKDYPYLEVLPVCADYHRPLRLPTPTHSARKTVFFFPGSTIGNLEPAEVPRFLGQFAAMSGRGDGFLLGIDLQKEVPVMEAAYNDKSGVTAAFIKNLLARANRELQTDFALDAFAHRAVYNARYGRVENQLVSRKEQVVYLDEEAIDFKRDEVVTVEHSYKYTLEGFQALVKQAGYEVARTWLDKDQLFSVHYLVKP